MKKADIYLLGAVVIVTMFGAIMIYYSSNVWAEYKFNDGFKYLKTQGLFVIIGFILMYIVAKIPYTYYLQNANKLLSICVLLLILVVIPGIGQIRNGSRSWFGIGGFGIQPSEFTKLALIIFVSKYLAFNSKFIKNIKKGVLPVLGIVMLIFGLIMLQPDFGTGTIIVMTIIALLFVSGVKMGFFVKIGFVMLAGAVGLIIMAPYRLARILSFTNPWLDPLGTGFQIIQSLYAIGPGGLLGMGLGNSIQKHFYLPEPQTDFIFSIISEELGFVGILLVAMFFVTIIYRGIRISLRCEEPFGKYLAFGIIFQLAFQTILNLMVVVGLIPVTGDTIKGNSTTTFRKSLYFKGI